MKVTDEMVERAFAALGGHSQPNVLRQALRIALEAALADVPEWPDPKNGLVPDRAFLQAQARAIAAEEKLAALEARTAKVREWELLNNGIHNAAWRELVEILDGEL